MQSYGRDWARLDQAVPGKTLVQIKNYFQNYKAKLGLDRLPLPVGAVIPNVRRRQREDPVPAGESKCSHTLHLMDMCTCHFVLVLLYPTYYVHLHL